MRVGPRFEKKLGRVQITAVYAEVQRSAALARVKRKGREMAEWCCAGWLGDVLVFCSFLRAKHLTWRFWALAFQPCVKSARKIERRALALVTCA